MTQESPRSRRAHACPASLEYWSVFPHLTSLTLPARFRHKKIGTTRSFRRQRLAWLRSLGPTWCSAEGVVPCTCAKKVDRITSSSVVADLWHVCDMALLYPRLNMTSQFLFWCNCILSNILRHNPKQLLWSSAGLSGLLMYVSFVQIANEFFLLWKERIQHKNRLVETLDGSWSQLADFFNGSVYRLQPVQSKQLHTQVMKSDADSFFMCWIPKEYLSALDGYFLENDRAVRLLYQVWARPSRLRALIFLFTVDKSLLLDPNGQPKLIKRSRLKKVPSWNIFRERAGCADLHSSHVLSYQVSFLSICSYHMWLSRQRQSLAGFPFLGW